MKEVIPGIYHLQLPIPDSHMGHVNTYLVRGDDGYLLIDTGWNSEEAFNSLKKQLAEIGIDLEDISQIVVTHTHPDHFGLAGRLKQLSQAKIALHYLEKARYTDMDEVFLQIEQWLHINGVPVNELPKLQVSLEMSNFGIPTLPDITLRGGETISTGVFNFQVLWTPGHSPGHISLYEPTQKILISGDHVLPTITPNISLNPLSSNNSLDDYLNSLNTVKQLEVSLVLPGHEQPFTGLQLRIEGLIQHHKQRNAEILKTLKADSKTAYQVSTGITWLSDVNGVSWQELTPWDKRIAVFETLAHLESMRNNGRVDKFFRNSTIYYRHT